MKLVYTEGCTAYSLAVDDKSSTELPLEEMKSILHKVIDKCDDFGTIQNMITSLLEQLGEYELIGHCDQCGDNIYEFTLNID